MRQRKNLWLILRQFFYVYFGICLAYINYFNVKWWIFCEIYWMLSWFLHFKWSFWIKGGQCNWYLANIACVEIRKRLNSNFKAGSFPSLVILWNRFWRSLFIATLKVSPSKCRSSQFATISTSISFRKKNVVNVALRIKFLPIIQIRVKYRVYTSHCKQQSNDLDIKFRHILTT